MAKDLIIVTGCSGRIGMRVMERFGKDYQVIGFDIVPPKRQIPGVEFMNVDLSSDASVLGAFDIIRTKYGNRIVSIVHLAAYYSFTGAKPELYDVITVGGTDRMLRGMQGFEVEQFLFSSTMLVHEPCEPSERINEEWPVVPSWDYPLSKVKTEKLISQKRGKTPSLVLRIAGCYDDGCHSIPISNQIQRIYEKQLTSRFFRGDLTHGASFLHMEDLIDSIWLGVQKRKELPPETVLVLGEEKTMPYDALQRQISYLIFGKEMRTIRIPKLMAKVGAYLQRSFIKPWMIDLADDNYCLDCSKAKRLLGWRPNHFVGDTLPIMINALKANSEAWYKENGLKK